MKKEQQQNPKKDVSDLKNKNVPNKNEGQANNLENLDKLKSEIGTLKLELETKNLKIIQLEQQIKDINDSYKNDVLKKASEAQVKLQEKIKEYQTKYENEIINVKKFALKDKAVELINIINNFENAVSMPTNNPEVANYVKGFSMFAGMFKSYLENNNIFEINVTVNNDYDAKTMEAFDTEQNPNFQPNKVIKVVKKGYRLHDIVIVPALVVVSK